MASISSYRAELSSPSFYRALLSEFLGTAILITAGCGGVVTMEGGQPVSNLVGALVFGFTVAMIVWTFGHLSGAHINPAVSVSFFVTGRLSLPKLVGFIIVQCIGAVAGAAVLWVLTPESWRGNMASTVLANDVTVIQGFFIEVIATFFLMLGVFACSDQLRTDHGGSMPLTVGLIVFMQSCWAGKTTGCSMNPARSLGPAVFAGTWDNHWIYWVAPFIGGVIGAVLYQYVLAETLPEVNIASPSRHPQTDIDVVINPPQNGSSQKQGVANPAFRN